MVPIHWLWPKEEVRLADMLIMFTSCLYCIIVYNLKCTCYVISFGTVRANFEFIEKLGVDLWCFHDRDIAPEGKTLEVGNLFSFKSIMFIVSVTTILCCFVFS